MKAKRMVRTIETHTLGQPTRTVVSGFKHIPGKTMAEKFNYMKDNEDWFRKFLSFEPRGSEIMSGTIITEPCTPGTDVGILYYEASGWLPMCGHDTIGVTVALIEAGLVDVTEPITQISLDTAAGVVDVEARVIDGVVEEVSFLNAPALVLNRNITVNTKDLALSRWTFPGAAMYMRSFRQKRLVKPLNRQTVANSLKLLSLLQPISTNRLKSSIQN